MLKPKWKKLAGWLVSTLGVGVLVFGIWQICTVYTPGPGPSSRIVELWGIVHTQTGIVISFFGLKLSRGDK